MEMIMTVKVLGLVRSCKVCPNHGYYSGGKSECRLVNEIVEDPGIVAPFCPLADFPSAKLSAMDATIRGLREPNQYGLSYMILSYLATQLRALMDSRGGITIALTDGTSVYLSADAVVGDGAMCRPPVIHFRAGVDDEYKLCPDGDRPMLYKKVKTEEGERPRYRACDLA